MKASDEWLEITTQLKVARPDELSFSASKSKKIVAVGCKERQCAYVFIYTREGWREQIVITQDSPARKNPREVPDNLVFGDKVCLTGDGAQLTVFATIHGRTPVPFLYSRLNDHWRRLV